MNKKLVYICNSLDRLKLLDKFNFKDKFNGEIYIVSDDRYMTVYKDIQNYINNEAININIKEAKFISLVNDIIPYVLPKMSLGSYVEDFKKLLFLSTLISSIYFCRDEKDLALILEDDCLLFKNPESIMTGLKACHTTAFLPTEANDDDIYKYFEILGGYNLVKNKLHLESDLDLKNQIYKKYGKLIGQATTVWKYLPRLPEYISKFMFLPKTIKNININRKRGSKLYHHGFALALEFFVSCILLSEGTDFYSDSEIIVQDRVKQIYKADKIVKGEIFGYHYTTITDEYIFEWLPYLMENGYSAYKEAVKDYKYEKHNKLSYLDNNLKNGFSCNGNFRKEEIKVNRHRRLI